MKIWIRLLVGAVIGVVLGILLPESGGDTSQLFRNVSDFVIHVGRYLLFPLVFFGVAIATHELREAGKSLLVYGKTLGLIIATTAVMAVLGTVSVLVLSPARVPPIFQEAPVQELPSFVELLYRLVPTNLFETFAQPGDFLLPVTLVAILIGVALRSEESHAGPLVNVLNAASRVFYRLNSFVIEVLAIGVIALAAAFVFDLRAITDFEIYSQLVIVILFDTGFMVFIVFPLVLYFLTGRENPFVWLFANIGPAVSAVFSGDSYFSTPTLMKAGKENLGIPRSVGSPAFSLATVLGKAGTALVTGASFVLILRSYTALEIALPQVLWVMGATFLFSFLLGSVPGMGVLVALSLLSGAYGRGMEEVFLILRPVSGLLISIGVFLDVITASFIGYVVAYSERMRRSVHQADFM